MRRLSVMSYFTFDGRIGRIEMLGAMTLAGVPAVAAAALSLAVFGKFLTIFSLLPTMGLNSKASPVDLPQAIFIIVSAIPTAWLYAAALVKRAHDRGKSGWWALLVLVPYIGQIWWIIDLVLMEGQKGPNNYGADPRAHAKTN